MSALGMWICFLLLPGAALLVVLISRRHRRLHLALNRMLVEGRAVSPAELERFMRRAALTRSALLCLYAAGGLFAAAGVLNASSRAESPAAVAGMFAIAGLGLAMLLAAAIILLREAGLGRQGAREWIVRAKGRG